MFSTSCDNNWYMQMDISTESSILEIQLIVRMNREMVINLKDKVSHIRYIQYDYLSSMLIKNDE